MTQKFFNTVCSPLLKLDSDFNPCQQLRMPHQALLVAFKVIRTSITDTAHQLNSAQYFTVTATALFPAAQHCV